MTLCQRFRQGDKEKSLEVRKDKITGDLYSRITDIQRIFPDAVEFEVNGVILNFLEDEDEQEYDPKRIAHYHNDIVNIVVASSAPVSSGPLSSAPFFNSGNPSLPPQSLSSQDVDPVVSNLSLQPAPPPVSIALVRTPLQHLAPPLSSSSSITFQAAALARPMAMLSTMEMGITQLQQQLDRSTNQQSVHHQQLLQQLIDMMAQQNELVRQQNIMLQEQAASKEREERILQEQAESKIREEQMLKMQQETIDRLTINQQRVEAILVQNYELHEYPIPRLFVVLPDSFSDWDPRNVLMERFRLYFLCECSDDCGLRPNQCTSSDQLRITAADAHTPISVKNSIHLAKHDGYELSRPTEFFDQYGPYVLGMLRILQHCLAVAAVAAPVAALADNGLKDIMDGVKSISENTIEAVNMSINILENKLGDSDVADGLAITACNGQEDNIMFENIAALEGADLRRLDTFLRNNDRDKILGNLYRITNEQGHVKWVCFEHYKETYRRTALSSFVQSVEASGGIYDPHLGQVTISLKSSTTSKNFFRLLASQAPAVQILDVTLDWNFGSTDLATLADMVAKSNVKVVKLDLQDDHTFGAGVASLRPGKGRYHSLLGLLSNTKLRSLQFFNFYLMGTRTSNLSSSFSAPWLQSFQFFGRVTVEDRIRLTNIISYCSQLVDLKLDCQGEWGFMDLDLHQAIFSLKNLRSLHLAGWGRGRGKKWNGDEENLLVDPQPMKEVIYPILLANSQYLTKIIRQSSAVLEVLVLYHRYQLATIDITSGASSITPHLVGPGEKFSEPLPSHLHLSALTHLDLQVHLTERSLQYLSTILPRLSLVHFGCSENTYELLNNCDFATLKSLSIQDMGNVDLVRVLDTMIDGTLGPFCAGLEQLFLYEGHSFGGVPTKLLKSVQLTRLYLDSVYPGNLTALLEAVELSKLEKLSICSSRYTPGAERALAKRIGEFPESLVIQLDEVSSKYYTKLDGGFRTTEGSPNLLPRHRVTRMDDTNVKEHHYRFLQPILPVYSF
ncbi:hypothetical protein BGZ96_009142 [Linnemannia gamsii]|uniref:Uncharacterized protein n=1 Tax=Linnemannia gamsii TaxID=64522 RepID=A0ABQ7KDF4_9FUNG|nr:hypothetical protein BGZ96_009142 [Linnemannia gamsii]